MSESKEKLIRYILGVLLILLAINAFAGGYYGMAVANDVPTEWLKGSPFSNYFIPSLILFICVGGSELFAAFTVLNRKRMAHKAAFVCVAIVFTWLIVQLLIIGYVSWMQPVTAITGLLILILAYLLPKYEY